LNQRDDARDVTPGLHPRLARVFDQRLQRSLRGFDIRVDRAVGQRNSRRRHQPRVFVREEGPHHFGGALATNRRQRADGREANVVIRILQSTLDCRQPALGKVATYALHRRQRSCPNVRRLVMEQQRRDQIAFVERLEQINRIDHTLLVRTGKFFDERLDRRKIRHIDAYVLGFDVAPFEALTKRSQVLAFGATGHHVPHGSQAKAHPTDLGPREPKTPRLDEQQDEDRTDTSCDPIDGDVDERLNFLTELGRQGQKQDFTGGLVDRVTH
jgi:hypothetical protein